MIINSLIFHQLVKISNLKFIFRKILAILQELWVKESHLLDSESFWNKRNKVDSNERVRVQTCSTSSLTRTKTQDNRGETFDKENLISSDKFRWNYSGVIKKNEAQSRWHQFLDIVWRSLGDKSNYYLNLI